jgi:hypothetical protein
VGAPVQHLCGQGQVVGVHREALELVRRHRVAVREHRAPGLAALCLHLLQKRLLGLLEVARPQTRLMGSRPPPPPNGGQSTVVAFLCRVRRVLLLCKVRSCRLLCRVRSVEYCAVVVEYGRVRRVLLFWFSYVRTPPNICGKNVVCQFVLL